MGVSTNAGCLLYIGTTASDGSTDSFTAIGEVTAIPEFGRSYNEIKYTPLATRGVQKFKGSYDDGSVAIPIGKDSSDVGQAALIVALDVDADYNFKIVDNDDVPPTDLTGVSMSAASPGVVTKTAHGLVENTPVKFTAGSGTLPTGITEGTTYYVKTVLSSSTFSVSATAGGAAINTTGSPSGTYTLTTVPVGTTLIFKAKVMSRTTKRDGADNVIMTTVNLGIKSGSITETARLPAA